MLLGCSLCLWLGAPVSDATELVREEPIPIQTIIADPQAFHLRAVRLQGIIQTIERFSFGVHCRGFDAYHFILDDHTGRLTISDFPECRWGGRMKPLISEFAVGDKVEVIIVISNLPSPNFASHSVEGTLRGVKRISELAGDESQPNR